MQFGYKLRLANLLYLSDKHPPAVTNTTLVRDNNNERQDPDSKTHINPEDFRKLGEAAHTIVHSTVVDDDNFGTIPATGTSISDASNQTTSMEDTIAAVIAQKYKYTLNNGKINNNNSDSDSDNNSDGEDSDSDNEVGGVDWTSRSFL